MARRLADELTEDQFKPLRLMNGLYLQLHAYVLRIAIPYGSLNARQARRLAWIARTYDKGYGHMTTRQNIQFNWIKLKDAPDILDALAEVETCTPSRPVATASATSPSTPMPEPRPRRVDDPQRVVRGPAPVVDPAPRVQLPAAQVQDRHHRRP